MTAFWLVCSDGEEGGTDSGMALQRPALVATGIAASMSARKAGFGRDIEQEGEGGVQAVQDWLVQGL